MVTGSTGVALPPASSGSARFSLNFAADLNLFTAGQLRDFLTALLRYVSDTFGVPLARMTVVRVEPHTVTVTNAAQNAGSSSRVLTLMRARLQHTQRAGEKALHPMAESTGFRVVIEITGSTDGSGLSADALAAAVVAGVQPNALIGGVQTAAVPVEHVCADGSTPSAGASCPATGDGGGNSDSDDDGQRVVGIVIGVVVGALVLALVVLLWSKGVLCAGKRHGTRNGTGKGGAKDGRTSNAAAAEVGGTAFVAAEPPIIPAAHSAPQPQPQQPLNAADADAPITVTEIEMQMLTAPAAPAAAGAAGAAGAGAARAAPNASVAATADTTTAGAGAGVTEAAAADGAGADADQSRFATLSYATTSAQQPGPVQGAQPDVSALIAQVHAAAAGATADPAPVPAFVSGAGSAAPDAMTGQAAAPAADSAIAPVPAPVPAFVIPANPADTSAGAAAMPSASPAPAPLPATYNYV